MPTTSDVQVYAGALVVDAWTEIICVAPDEDGDLSGYTVSIHYTPDGSKTPIEWPTGPLVPVKGLNKQGLPIVRALIVPVVPLLPPPGCLGKFIPKFPKRRSRPRHPESPIGSGTLTGTLDPPPPPPPPPSPPPSPGGGPVSGPTTMHQRKFKIMGPAIYYGIEV